MENQQGAVRGAGAVEKTEADSRVKKERALQQRCKKYGITVDFYNRLGESQGWRCAICGRHQSEFHISLAIDHAHFKITAWREAGMWHAQAEFQGHVLARSFEKTKKMAVEKVRQVALPRSVRGLLCPGRYGKAGHGCCNRLIGNIDNIGWLEKVSAYLKNPPAHELPA